MCTHISFNHKNEKLISGSILCCFDLTSNFTGI